MSPSIQKQFQILVVDDDQPVRSLVLQTLLNAGYTCQEAANGEEALHFLASNPVDVLITDIQMPVMGGIELTRCVRQQYNCDVIMMTGYVEDFTYEKMIEKGASDFLQKPLDGKELIVRLKRVLRERENLKERKRIQTELQISLGRLPKPFTSTTKEWMDPVTPGACKVKQFYRKPGYCRLPTWWRPWHPTGPTGPPSASMRPWVKY